MVIITKVIMINLFYCRGHQKWVNSYYKKPSISFITIVIQNVAPALIAPCICCLFPPFPNSLPAASLKQIDRYKYFNLYLNRKHCQQAEKSWKRIKKVSIPQAHQCRCFNVPHSMNMCVAQAKIHNS